MCVLGQDFKPRLLLLYYHIWRPRTVGLAIREARSELQPYKHIVKTSTLARSLVYIFEARGQLIAGQLVVEGPVTSPHSDETLSR